MGAFNALPPASRGVISGHLLVNMDYRSNAEEKTVYDFRLAEGHSPEKHSQFTENGRRTYCRYIRSSAHHRYPLAIRSSPDSVMFFSKN